MYSHHSPYCMSIPLEVLLILLVDSKGTDQTVQKHSLIWVFTVHIFHKDTFHSVQPIGKIVTFALFEDFDDIKHQLTFQ